MDSVTRVRDHFAESIATKQAAAEKLVDSIVAAGQVTGRRGLLGGSSGVRWVDRLRAVDV